MKKSRRKKNEQTKRRFDAIKDLMSTFAMSTVAVVAVVTLIPSSPEAEITKVVALNEEIAYQVTVTDKDNALDLSTLYVVLETQFESYEQPITLGEQSGFFENLEYETEYRLSVYGSKGFGQERLDTLMITTGEKVGGTILTVTPDGAEYASSYFVDVSINDPTSKYLSVDLYYGSDNEHEEEILYSSVPVTLSRMQIGLFDIYSQQPLHIYLEATTVDGTEILDEIWVTPPYNFEAYLSIRFINSTVIGFYVSSGIETEKISYEMNVHIDEELISNEQVVFEASEYEGGDFIIDDLSPGTTYMFECIATYTHPQTLRQEQTVIYSEAITTLDTYTYTYNVETFDEYYEVTINLDDPSNYFQAVYYESTDTSGEYDMYITSNSSVFIGTGSDKSVTITIPKPTASTYRITIKLRNQDEFTITHTVVIITNE